MSAFAKRTTSGLELRVGELAAVALRLALPVVGDPVAEAGLDMAVDAVVRDVELAAEIPLRVRQLPLVELGERLEPGDALAALALPELVEAALVDVGLRHRERRELRRRRVAPVLDEDRLDRLVAHSSKSYGKVRQHLGAVGGDEDQILEPDAAVAVAVEPRLERDHVALDERLALDPADAGPLVHLEADAVAGRVEVAVDERLALLLVQLRLVPVLVEEVADLAVDVAPLTPGLTAATARSSASFASRWYYTQLVRRRAEHERPREVRVAGRLAVARVEVEKDDVVGGDRAGAAVVADRGLCAVRDGELLRCGAVLAERALDLELDPLAGERLPVEGERAVRSRGGPQQLDTDRDTRLDRAASAADTGELVLGLDTTALVEEARVGGQRPVRAEVVRVAEREAARRDRALEPERAGRREVDLLGERIGVEAALEQLVDADVLEREHLEVGAEVPDPAGLERADDDAALAAHLRIEEGIGDRERHLVPQLGRADGVRDDQDVRHRARSYR